MCRFPTKRAAAGTLLLEWLIAMALGIFLSGLLIQLFQQTLADQLAVESRLKAMLAAGVADRLLHDSLYRRGRLPCDDAPQLNLVRSAGDAYWRNRFPQRLQVHPHDSTEANQIRRIGNASGRRIAGSDVVVALNVGFPTIVTDHDEAQARFTLKDDLELEVGEFAVVCDEHLSVLFQIARLPAPRQVIWQGTAINPGNCSMQANTQSACPPDAAHRFSDGALFARLEPITWYVGHSYNSSSRSLYRERLSLVSNAGRVSARMRREEILEGVSLLRAQQLASNLTAPANLEIGIVASAYLGRPQPPPPITLLGRDVSHWLNERQQAYFTYELNLIR